MLATHNIEEMLEELCGDRRHGSREVLRGAQISTRRRGTGNYSDSPVVEYTGKGARVLLNGTVADSDTLEVKIRLDNLSITGNARIAWTAPMTNGTSVAGIQFLDLHSLKRS